VRSASGDVQVAGVKGDVAITSESGEISVKDAQAAKLTSVSGDIELHEVRGAIDAKTTSGALNIQGEIRQALRYTSVSGDLTLSGPCRLATCKITAETCFWRDVASTRLPFACARTAARSREPRACPSR
jgi:DUF4097 and DUF4098 domain-containing protein YvlB